MTFAELRMGTITNDISFSAMKIFSSMKLNKTALIVPVLMVAIDFMESCKSGDSNPLPSFLYVQPLVVTGFHKMVIKNLKYLESYSICYRNPDWTVNAYDPGCTDKVMVDLSPAVDNLSNIQVSHYWEYDVILVDLSNLQMSHNWGYDVVLQGVRGQETVTILGNQKVTYSPGPPPPTDWSSSAYSGKPGDHFTVDDLHCGGMIDSDRNRVLIGGNSAGGCSDCCTVPQLAPGPYTFELYIITGQDHGVNNATQIPKIVKTFTVL